MPVVAAYRQGHADSRLAPTMAALARRDPFRVVLTGLDVTEVRTLVRSLCGREADAEV